MIEKYFLAKLKDVVKEMRLCQDNKMRYMCAAKLYMSTLQLHVHVEGVYFYLTSLMLLSSDEQQCQGFTKYLVHGLL